jgi:hypothetical protein
MIAAIAAAGLSVAQYDGVAELEAGSLEDILKLFLSEEYEKVIIMCVKWPKNSNRVCRTYSPTKPSFFTEKSCK